MSEWIVDVRSMIPQGDIGERMVVAKVDRVAGTYALMHAPTLTTHKACESFGDDQVFMRSGWSDRFSKNEIDQFLQAMMDAGWERGLRPAGFDPSVGELAAVNRHLEDLRKLVMVRAETLPVTGEQPKPAERSEPEDPKKW